MFIPTAQQQKIVDHFDGNSLVIAGPGSGKTCALIAHVKKLVKDRKISRNDIWIMAFNRDISLKLKEKIIDELGENSPPTTTIHTFILSQTRLYGNQLIEDKEIAEGLGECGLEKLLWRPIRIRLKKEHDVNKTPEGKKFTINYVKNRLRNQIRNYWLTSKESSNDLFTKFKFEMERFQEIYKIVFLDELAINFFMTIKANPSFRRDVIKPIIIIDEFQDLNPTEHAILHQFHSEGTVFAVFGDDDQAVCDFRRAHADFIIKFDKLCSPKRYPLSRDRRCPKEILDLADTFVKALPKRFEKPGGHALHRGKIDILNYPNDEDEVNELPHIIHKYISIFPKYEENPQILVLSGTSGRVRGRSRIDEIIEVLKDAEIIGVTGERREDPLDNDWGLAFKSVLSILEIGLSPTNLACWLSIRDLKLMREIIDHIEKEERKGNQFNFLEAVKSLRLVNKKIENVLSEINDLKKKIEEIKFHPKLIEDFLPENIEGKKEAEAIIKKVWEKCLNENTLLNDINPDIAVKKDSFLIILRDYIDENIKKSEIGRVHVTTYRKAKGLEADLVIVTSVDTREFPKNPQKMRLLYVSATRAKKNLIFTFADKRTKARRFFWGGDSKYQGVPTVYRSYLLPSNYNTQIYSEKWLENWQPV